MLKIKPSLTTKWDKHYKKWDTCTRCNLHKTSNYHVLARGEIPCDFVFIGEAPGKTEDYIGFPFVGPAGKVLNEWIIEIKKILRKKHIYFKYAIINTIACRPCDSKTGPNRGPMQHEISKCMPRVKTFIKLAKPIGIIFLGKTASAIEVDILKVTSIITTVSVYHPSYVLRLGQPESLMIECIKEISDFVEECKIWQEILDTN